QRQISTSALPDGYFQWSVQSVGAALNTSKFASPQEFTIYKNSPANAPTNLRLLGVADGAVTLVWSDNSNDESSFTIERSSESGNSGFEAIHEAAPNSATYADNTVSFRSVYYYRIRLNGSAAVA